MTFWVATFNVGDGSDDRKIADLEHLTDDFDVTVIGCQEGSDRRRALKRFVKRNPSWRVYQPHTPGGAAVPILWDGDEWRRLRFRSVLAVARTWVGPKGAGPLFSKTKRLTVVVLRRRETGRAIKVLNWHAVPSSYRHDLSPAEAEARRRVYRAQVDQVERIVRRSRIPVVVTTDDNAPLNYDLLDGLRAVLDGWTEEPTHKDETFDHVLYTDDLDETDNEEIVPTSSDHDVVVKTLAHR